MGGLDQRAWRRFVAAKNGRSAGAKDPSLLACDRLEVRAQPFRVIDPERNDDRDVGVDDVYRVEPPAHADLEDDRVRPGGIENQERRERIELEEGQGIRSERIGDPLERRDKRGRRDRVSLEPDALGIVDEVRRGEGGGAVALLAENRIGERDAGALAVGATDRDHRAARRRPPAAPGDPRHPLETGLDGLRMERELPVEPSAEAVEPHRPRHLRRAPPRPPDVAGG